MTYLIVQVHFCNFTVNSTHSIQDQNRYKNAWYPSIEMPVDRQAKMSNSRVVGSRTAELTSGHPWEAMGVSHLMPPQGLP